MSMAATLGMGPGPFEQTFIHLWHWGSKWNLTLTVVSEEEMFENVDGRRTSVQVFVQFKNWALLPVHMCLHVLMMYTNFYTIE